MAENQQRPPVNVKNMEAKLAKGIVEVRKVGKGRYVIDEKVLDDSYEVVDIRSNVVSETQFEAAKTQIRESADKQIAEIGAALAAIQAAAVEIAEPRLNLEKEAPK